MRRITLAQLMIAAALTFTSPACAVASTPRTATTDDMVVRIQTDNIPRAEIATTCWRAPAGTAPRGTVFMCHGFGRSMWDFRGYRWLADDEHFNVVRFDFREHGQSSHSLHLPTLGYYEIYDLKAVI